MGLVDRDTVKRELKISRLITEERVECIDMTKGQVILLNGVTSSGKSTLARKLKALMPKYFIIGLDDMIDILFVLKDRQEVPESSHYILQQNFNISFRPYMLHRITKLVHEYAFNVIVDTVISDQQMHDDFATLFKGENVLRVGVQCPIEELERREKARGDREVGMARQQIESVHAYVPYDIEVDTFLNTAEECALQIVEKLQTQN